MSLRVTAMAVGLILTAGMALAQTPPAPPPAQTPPAQPPAQAPAQPPAQAPTQAPARPPAPSNAAPAPRPGDPFGEEVTLTAKTIVYLKGSANWDSAFETLVAAFKKINAELAKQGVKPSGPPMTIYTSTDDTGFEFQAAIPVDEAPKGPLPEGLVIGSSPQGKALKFLHRGSYDAMDSTYEAITNHLDERRLEAKDLFVEYYVTDPMTTKEDDLVIEVYVPISEVPATK
jgi:effector-binding domain-containing protein